MMKVSALCLGPEFLRLNERPERKLGDNRMAWDCYS